ncbi:MAG: ABC transporter permease subunit [Chloroflexota bacterium]|nr:ABC transporter permease subunit [Chloroflexota bacterium]
MEQLSSFQNPLPPQLPDDPSRPSDAMDSDPKKSSARRLDDFRQSTAVSLIVFLLRRLLFGTVILGAITFLTFWGLEMARGTSLATAISDAIEMSLAYLGNLLQGNLGLTEPGTLQPRAVPVSEVLWGLLKNSLGLLAVSLSIATAVGILMGIWSANWRRSGWSTVMIVVSVIGVSIPSFFAALLLQLLMVESAKATGRPLLPIGGFGWDKHILLPAIVLATRPIAQIARMTFISVGDILDQDYVRTARGKGLWPRQIWWRYVLKNAAVPILTTIGVSTRFALSSLPVIEYFFGWPGLGWALLKSITIQDDDLTVALVLCLGILFILINLLLDLSYRVVDPRLREQEKRVGQNGGGGVLERLQDFWRGVTDWIRYNPLRNWWQGRNIEPAPSPFATLPTDYTTQPEVSAEKFSAERRRAWWRGTLGNAPFMLGLMLVMLLLAVFIFGPRFTPHNPYLTQGLQIVDGEFLMPPFEPGGTYPLGTDVLGRDILSLILAGLQQTMILAVLVVLARVVLGSLLGTIAGWNSGSWIDRLLMGLVEILAAFPMLLLAMILILALGIRNGMLSFVIALSLAGWGEIMQYVRGEVMTIRHKAYIESAVAVGLRTPGLLVRHVTPNLLPGVISLAALEMGAVLMLLGELGFIGIFIGGGAFAELDIAGQPYHYSDVPEWASLLSSVRAYARAYPWVAIYPALAFFLAIVGFNLFGEGLRRMVETVGIGLNRLVNRYTVGAGLVALLAIGWVQTNTGSIAYYKQETALFDGQRSFEHVQALASPEFQDRKLGTAGLAAGADYVAAQFKVLGLQPAGEKMSYLQTRQRAYMELNGLPQLVVEDGGAPAVYMDEYIEYPSPYINIGEAKGDVRVVLANDLDPGNYQKSFPALREEVMSEDIVLVLSDQEASYFRDIPIAGLLVLAEDPVDLRRHYTLSTRTRAWDAFGTNRRTGGDFPTFRISEGLVERLLNGSGESLDSLRARRRGLGRNEVQVVDANGSVAMSVSGKIFDHEPAYHVIGHMPGVSGRATAGDLQMDDQVVIVLAQYDSPPFGPTGCCPATNDNASGIGVMLETIRVLQQSDYQPYRTFLFIAYSGEGREGGESVQPHDVSKFLQAKAGFATTLEVEAIVHLRGLGGSGERLQITAGGNQRLAKLFESAARQVGAATVRNEDAVDLSIVFAEGSGRAGDLGQEAPTIGLTWEDWQGTARTAEDTMETVSADNLEMAGKTLALALMIIGRENRY